MLNVGDRAPDFSLPASNGAQKLSALRGKKVVLYFYPKDDTPGCTRESCDFRDGFGALTAEGVMVLGVSKDSLESHAKFRQKYDLPFALLTDADNQVAKTYGAYGEKTLYGKTVLGTIRSTFLIDEQGRIAKIWSPVKVDGHAAAVLTAAGVAVPKALASEPPAKRPAAAKAKPNKAGKQKR